MSRNAILKASGINEIATLYAKDRIAFLNAVEDLYANTVVVKSMTTKTKTGILVVLLASWEREFLSKLHSEIDLPEMLKACKVLDGGRALRAMKRRIVRLRKERKIRAAKREITQHEQMMKEYAYGPLTGTLTSSRRDMVKAWAKSIPKDKLQYRAYLFKTDGWKELADMIHFAGTDFQLPWFMKYCFEGISAAPEGALVQVLNQLTTENFGESYARSELPYECLRMAIQNLSTGLKPEDKLMIIQRENLRVVLWYWRELSTPAGDQVFAARLSTAAPDQLDSLTYGKLLDAILATRTETLRDVLIRIAEDKLRTYKCTVEQPVGVLCDASSSMQVAIRTSSIFTSLISVVSNATLQVFNNANKTAQAPTTVQQAVRLAQGLRADGSTSPAASLYHYHKNGISLRTVIIVTDEEENTAYDSRRGWTCDHTGEGYFAELWKRYVAEVAPEAKLVFVSFTESNGDAQMVRDLRTVMGDSYVDECVTVHKVDRHNPDLNRLDYILATMSTDTRNASDAVSVPI